MSLALLQFAKRANVFQDTIEIILAADRAVGLGVCCVERDSQLVEIGLDQRAAIFLV
jgi:hypothetical protein